tara:strand:+ start:297 stop:1451 length:1155 start_codon:yes stop_codon:yes gene_type:complete
LIGQSVDNNSIQIKVLGFGQHISMGLNKGEVTDLLKLSDSISKAVEKAEEMAGFRISNITCNVTGGLPFTRVTSDKLQITGDLIKKEDILYLLNLDKHRSKYKDYIQLRRKPKVFKIENDQEVENPIGFKSKTLILEAINTYVNKNIISNLNKSIELCHLNVNQFYITPEINGISTMIKEERELGAIIIDIGASLTSIGVYLKDSLIYSSVIKIGGIHITSDLVKGLGTESEEAEKLKILHGSAVINQLDDFKNIDVKIINEKGELTSHSFHKSMLVGIIKPRVEEIFELVIENLNNGFAEYSKISKVIITGGTSNLHGISNIAKSYFKCDIRIGKPIGLLNAPDLIQSPNFSCLVGLVLKSSRDKKSKGFFSFLYKLKKYFFN